MNRDTPKEKVWSTYFKMNSFRKAAGIKKAATSTLLPSSIVTDGVSISIPKRFQTDEPQEAKKTQGKKRKRTSSSQQDETEPFKHIELKDKRVIAIDPGRKDLVTSVDYDGKTFQPSSFTLQRSKQETKANRAQHCSSKEYYHWMKAGLFQRRREKFEEEQKRRR